MQSIFYSLQVRHVRISIVQIAWNNGHILEQTTFFMHLSFRNLWTVALFVVQQKWFPKKCHTICQTVSKPIYLLQFFFCQRWLRNLETTIFLSVDNFAKEKLKKNDYTPKMSHNLSRRFENLFVFRFFIFFFFIFPLPSGKMTWHDGARCFLRLRWKFYAPFFENFIIIHN